MRITKIAISLFIICVLMLAAVVCRAQKEVSDFGVFTRDEINMKQCDFDKDADAVVLLDKASSNYNDYHNLITERRIRIKILKERGIQRGNIHIRYYSGDGFETIYGVEATVLSFDGQHNQELSKLDRKAVYNTKLNRYYSEITFALPNIKVGSIFEYSYHSQMKHYGGLREWIFQSDMPVVLSSYHLVIVPNAEFAYSVYKTSYLHVDVKNEKESGILFEMSNIPGLRDEAYMGSAHDYLQRVKFQFAAYNQTVGDGINTSTTTTKYSTTWKELAKELMDNPSFGTQITKSLAGADAMQLVWAAEPSAFARMTAIHHYVQSHITWDEIYSKYTIDGIKTAWEKKTGSTGDINLILINLLKGAGLAVKPLLVSERDNGKVDTTYPFSDQFDKVVAYVTLDDKSYILDATDHETPSFIIPFQLLNTTGFIVDRKTPALVKIADDTKMNSSLVSIAGVISDAGNLQLEATVSSYDYSKIERKEKYHSDKKKYEREFFEPFMETDLDTFNIDGVDSDSMPMLQNAKLHSHGLSKTGDYFLLNYNLFTGLTKNPFINEQRFSDINFGCKYSYSITGVFELPAHLTPEALPKNIRLQLPDKSMSLIRQIEQRDNSLTINAKVDLSRTEFSADEYPQVQAFYKQMLDLLNEPIVLKEK